MKLNNELRKMKKRKMKNKPANEGEKMKPELNLELVYLDPMSDLMDK